MNGPNRPNLHLPEGNKEHERTIHQILTAWHAVGRESNDLSWLVPDSSCRLSCNCAFLPAAIHGICFKVQSQAENLTRFLVHQTGQGQRRNMAPKVDPNVWTPLHRPKEPIRRCLRLPSLRHIRQRKDHGRIWRPQRILPHPPDKCRTTGACPKPKASQTLWRGLENGVDSGVLDPQRPRITDCSNVIPLLVSL